ncbi:DUF2637 domain-containing protein [Streptomyces sp. bgisy100]|uniref:DUF2637 domain-containing protein n=1 Tax=Streptomyces sp. bgisy100 TaxID=3413783 RepID=UPI003D74EDBD
MTAGKTTKPVEPAWAHRILIGVVVAGAIVIAAIGFAGSYSAVRELAAKKGFGGFSGLFPIGIDAGIVVLLALDLLLTWIRIPFPLLRQTAWLLTAATIAFNGAAAWPDPLGVGMHAVIPVLFVVAVEAARHAVGRIADITADRHMESVRVARWLLAFPSTFRLWRRMKLWELRSYDEVIQLEQDRLVYQARLRARYGRSWRRRAPVESLMPLRLARYGVPLSRTGAAGLAAAGIDPAVLPAGPGAPDDRSHAAQAVVESETVAPRTANAGTDPQSLESELATPAQEFPVTAETRPDSPLADALPAASVVSTDGRAPGPAVAEPLPVYVPLPQSIAAQSAPAVAEQHRREPVPASSADSVCRAGDGVPQQTAPADVAATAKTSLGEPAVWNASHTNTGQATARLPEQQSDDPELDPVQQQIVTVAEWLAEAEDAGQRLSGAEVARRFGLSPKTGQRRVNAAAEYLEEQRRQEGRIRLRSVRS